MTETRTLDAPPSCGSGVPQAYLSQDALSAAAELRERLGVRMLRVAGDGTSIAYRPALLARARVTWRPENVATWRNSDVDALLYPLPDAPDWARWGIDRLLPLPEQAVLTTAQTPARWTTLPSWLDSVTMVRAAERAFERALSDRPRLPVPRCAPLDRWGDPGETLPTFYNRVAGELRVSCAQVSEEKRWAREQQREMLDKRVADVREALEMDRREIGLLKQQGSDPEDLERVNRAVRGRMGEYRDKVRQRNEILEALDLELANVELDALAKLEKAEIVDVRLDVDKVDARWLGILWIPN